MKALNIVMLLTTFLLSTAAFADDGDNVCKKYYEEVAEMYSNDADYMIRELSKFKSCRSEFKKYDRLFRDYSTAQDIAFYKNFRKSKVNRRTANFPQKGLPSILKKIRH